MRYVSSIFIELIHSLPRRRPPKPPRHRRNRRVPAAEIAADPAKLPRSWSAAAVWEAGGPLCMDRPRCVGVKTCVYAAGSRVTMQTPGHSGCRLPAKLPHSLDAARD